MRVVFGARYVLPLNLFSCPLRVFYAKVSWSFSDIILARVPFSDIILVRVPFSGIIFGKGALFGTSVKVLVIRS